MATAMTTTARRFILANIRETPAAWKPRAWRAISHVVSSRALVLGGLALAVLAAGVYLFIQVHASPAEAKVTAPEAPTHVAQSPGGPDSVDIPAPNPTEPRVAKPLGRPMGAGEIRPQADQPQTGDTQPTLTNDVPEKADPRFQMILGEANKAYDRQDFDEARAIATKVLAKDPTNTRMLRIMVSSYCIESDSVTAQTYYDKLPEFDRQQMTKRCATYGVSFKEPGQQ
jgi:hypothetical protein